MTIQPQIDLLTAKLQTGDNLTPLEVQALLKLLKSIMLSGQRLDDSKVESIAFAAAHNVCESGAVDSRRHNTAVIAQAIRDYHA